MANFVIDTTGDVTENGSKSTKKDDETFLKLLFSDFNDCLRAKFGDKASSIATKPAEAKSKDNHKGHSKNIVTAQRIEARKALEKSDLLKPDFEKLHAIPPLEVSVKQMRKQKKAEREKTKGDKWYGLPAPEMTDEIKHDLEVLQMRSVLDPKHFYKKNDLKVLPKYFQIGKVMDSPLDFHSDRLSKKERKKTLVDELLADAEFNRYNKRKYQEIITEKQKTHYKAWRQAKRLKKKK